MPIRFETATEDIWVMGAALDIGDDGLARSITQVLYEVPGLGRPGFGGSRHSFLASSATSRNGRNQGM